jgi:aryl-alcohol dehydrogenase-like predicted oxidoreductase
MKETGYQGGHEVSNLTQRRGSGQALETEGVFMTEDFAHATLGKLGSKVFRLGLSASYRPGKNAIRRALDEGVNYLFFYGFDGQMIDALREVMPANREKYLVATGAYNLIWTRQDLRRTLEKRLRQLRTDYIDVFHFLGVMKPREFPEPVREELRRLKEDGRVRAVAMSCHDRKFAGELAARGELDVLMLRYNAAHRGAERDIFPHLEAHHPGIVSYTATRWTYLLRAPHGWPKDGRIPTAPMCYRFVLSNPHVDVCLMAPSNLKQLEENLSAIRQGPLSDEEMRWMQDFGDAVHSSKKWFM